MKEDSALCPACGADLDDHEICRACGWDGALAHRARRKKRFRPGAWLARLVLWLLPFALVAGMGWHWIQVGPGPDLSTTLRWLALGDGGRAAELVTLNRAYEIARAASRYSLGKLQTPSLEGDWAAKLEPFSTGAVRGWLPMLYCMADAEGAPVPVQELYAIKDVDGWGRPYRVRTTSLGRGTDPASVPEVAADLKDGLQASLFTKGELDLAKVDWMRLELDSSGPDGRFDDGDDVALVAYVPVSHTLRLGRTSRQLSRELETAYLQGKVLFRLEGNHWDLIDARLLAEHRLDALS